MVYLAAGLSVRASTRNGISAGSMNAVDESCGIRTMSSMTSIPGMRVKLLDSTIPATASSPPASRSMGRQRVRMTRGRRIRPMTASSAPVRIHLWICPVGANRPNLGAAFLPTSSADEFHTTKFRRCDRRLIAASCARLRSVSPIVRFCAPRGACRARKLDTEHPPRDRAYCSGTTGSRTRQHPRNPGDQRNDRSLWSRLLANPPP